MPVLIKYIVERDGIEKMTFTSKAEADAYDKLLDTADALYELLDQSNLAGDSKQKEALSMYLAEHKNALIDILGSKKKSPTTTRKTPKANAKKVSTSVQQSMLEDLVIEPDEQVAYEEEENTIIFDDDVSEFTDSDAAA